MNIDTSNINNKQNDNNSDNNQLIVPISSSDKENIVNKAEAKKNYKNILEKDRTNNALNHIFNEDAADKSVKRNIENIINEIF
ncbi:hypothetical protein [Pectinatus sottacetonis]|uniref:hypothetical protein n=1 Tax=Pectinatus sottacetonis TaxID=1002795 RepID=UPI0018C6054B|nr:hypothetical protein [Pectinatus sottacetonis]